MSLENEQRQNRQDESDGHVGWLHGVEDRESTERGSCEQVIDMVCEVAELS